MTIESGRAVTADVSMPHPGDVLREEFLEPIWA